ncbi:hypothetical protein IAQ61_006325, partial [Plenodomus lingam]|uniref:uncharacterized protein n=1 Tax=Leptosphaeria maculans TaxID=5022 RepID=UPI00331D0B4D
MTWYHYNLFPWSTERLGIFHVWSHMIHFPTESHPGHLQCVARFQVPFLRFLSRLPRVTTQIVGSIMTSLIPCVHFSLIIAKIIVGGSTAGLVLATRLSEALPRHCIAVMESGSDGCNESKIYIPGLRGFAFGYTYDWSLPMVPQLHMWPGLYRSLLLRIYRHTSKLAFLT